MCKQNRWASATRQARISVCGAVISRVPDVEDTAENETHSPMGETDASQAAPHCIMQ